LKNLRDGRPYADLDQLLYDIKQGFISGLDDDLNISTAMASIFKVVKKVNSLVRDGQIDAAGAGKIIDAFPKPGFRAEPARIRGCGRRSGGSSGDRRKEEGAGGAQLAARRPSCGSSSGRWASSCRTGKPQAKKRRVKAKGKRGAKGIKARGKRRMAGHLQL
jgi:hypothetical protein